MQDKADEELTGLAVEFETARDERVAKGTVERIKKNALEIKMNEKSLTHYRDSSAGIEVYFETQRNLKVRRIKDEGEEGDKD